MTAARVSAPRRPRSRAPILVTGAHRSGTTWVGRMLALAPGVGYVHEPFNPRVGPGLSPARFDRYYSIVTAENEARYLPGLERTLRFEYDLPGQLRVVRGPRDLARAARDLAVVRRKRRAGLRPLVKDPIALLSTEWLAARFGMDVVVLVRHPAAFAASLKRLGWSHDFESFLGDGRVPEVLRPYEDEIREQAEQPGGPVEQAALLWRVLYNAVDGYRERHPEWTYLRHEDASADPQGTFERLFEGLGLELTAQARAEIARRSGPQNPSELRSPHAVELDSAASLGRWREQLSAAEVELLREQTGDVWPRFYAPDDW